jgi:plastocyanin
VTAVYLRGVRNGSVAFLLLLALFAPATAGAAEHDFTLRAGPYRMSRYETQFPNEFVRTPEVTGFLTRMHARLVDRRGDPVPVSTAMLHHVLFINQDRPRLPNGCAGGNSEGFYGTGEEDQSLDLPPGYGYRVRGRDRWRMSAMVMAHRFHTAKVYVEYSGTVDTSRELTGVRPFWLRANGCSSSLYNVFGGGSPGTFTDRVNHWQAPITGRIVAAGGHLHAGSVGLQLRDPGCGDRVLFDATPFYAPADDLLYRAKPRLHEAGPVQTSWFSSPTGIPVAKGQPLDLHGLYENDHARQSVMAIAHIYIAPGGPAPVGCPPLPADARQATMKPGLRTSAPYEPIPLYRLDDRHLPVVLPEPEGTVQPLATGDTIALRNYRFQPFEKVVVTAGTTINWRFDDVADHNLTLASGPSALGGETMHRGGRASTQFNVPGRYQLFCYLHPMTMHEQVDVIR